MRRQRHRKERGGKRRRVFSLASDGGPRLEFSSKTSLFQWARQEARERLAGCQAPWVHLTARGHLLAHPSRAAYEHWVMQPRASRNRMLAGSDGSLLLGRVRQTEADPSAPQVT